MFSGLKGALAAIAAIGLVSCASTLPTTDTAFDESSQQSLLVVTGELQQVRGTSSDYFFRKVDLQTRKFVGETVRIGFGFAKADYGDELREASGERVKARTLFAVKPVTPGHYALIGQSDVSNSTNYVETADACYADQAPVFDLSAGQIQIVDAYRGPLLSFNTTSPKRVAADRIISDFEKLRSDYPKIRGKAVVLSEVAVLDWSIEGQRFFGPDLIDRCKEAEIFRLLP